jgi:superfamily II DNA or RNA helicase
MSAKILLSSLTEEEAIQIDKDLLIDVSVASKNKFARGPKKMVEIFDRDDTYGYLPFAYAKSKKLKCLKGEYKSIDVPFIGELREHQKEVKSEAIKLLNTHGTTIISCYPGFGKTLSAIYLSSKIKLQTLIIINLLVLKDQWIESIHKVCPSATVSFLVPGSRPDFDADFLIVNAINVCKFDRKSFSTIGTVIVDEVHLIMSEVLSKSLFYICPKYLLGLSATPYRQDGMDILLTLFFTEHRIVRKMYRKHTVYRITTGIQPEMEYDRDGKVNWNSIIESISNNAERNDKIVNVICNHSSRNFLVLCKRVSQARYIYDKLIELGESASLYVEKSTTFDKDARILVGTIKKLGVGFDHQKLDTLFAAVDLESYFIQYLGRIFRTPDGVEPVVFDMLDDNSILKRHYKSREKVYKETGGTIRELEFNHDT